MAEEVAADANDHGKLNAMVDEVAVVAGEPPEAVLADAGYASEKELAQLEEREVEGYVALGREGRSIRRPDSTRRPASARMAQRLTSRGRSCGLCTAEVDGGSTDWLDQARDGFPPLQCPRGLEQVQGEWTLVCLALNLRRLNGRLAPC